MNRKKLSETNRLVVKIGSSLLEKRNSPIPDLVDELAELHDLGKEIVLVTSGAIHFGMKRRQAGKSSTTLPDKQASAAVGQPYLMKYYGELFDRNDITVGQILLTQEAIDNRESYLNASNTLNWMIRNRIVPIVNENDTVATDEIQFGNNDTLAAMVTTLVDADLLVILTDVEGLYQENPDSEEEPIETVESIDESIHEIAGPPGKSESSVGGMATKVEAAESVTQSGTPLVVASGYTKTVIKNILDGDNEGTLFQPKKGDQATRGRKRWIGYHLLPKGYIQVDQGAAQAIKQRGTSLLPAGITDAVGRFERGDVVKIVNDQGQEFARGMTNYNPQEVNQLKGCQTGEISDILGYHDFDEIIHRDNMVVFNDD